VTEGRIAVLSLAGIATILAAFAWWDYHQASTKCHRAGAALNKVSEYSLGYGCFLDGVPSEMIREVNP